MTPDEARIDALTQQQDEELLAAEEQAQQEATQQVGQRLAILLAGALAAWSLLHDGDRAGKRRIVAQLQMQLRAVPVAQITSILHTHALAALESGVQQGAEQGNRPPGWQAVTPELPRAVLAAIDGAGDTAREELNAAADALFDPRDVRDIEAAFACAHRAVTRTNATASWAVGRSLAAGVRSVADVMGAGRLWIGERDACLHCLAYFGVIAGPGEVFPTGLTYGRKPLRGLVPDPPLHPHCRCRIVVWDPSWADTGPDSYPAALKREARRSVARGWSLESESNAARVDAAGRLLAKISGNGMLPASVESYAARAVRLGQFPRGRRFPV